MPAVLKIGSVISSLPVMIVMNRRIFMGLMAEKNVNFG